MSRRRQPPTGSVFAVSPSHDPGTWLGPFLAYLDAECGMSRNTIAAYRRDLEKFVGWNRANHRTPVHEICLQTMTAFLEFLQGHNLAAATIGRNLVTVRMFFRYLLLEGVVARTTVDLISSPKLWQRLPRVLSPDSVDQLLTAPTGVGDRYFRRDRALLAMMYATGCRVSEVVGLRISDLNRSDSSCRFTVKGNKERMV